MDKYLDKARTTIHIDGEPSMEKSEERKSRQERLDKDIAKLTDSIKSFSQRKRGSPASLFRKCRNAFRLPRSVLDEIANGLRDLGWNICRCQHQADTHIGELCQMEPDKSQLAVITGDSDLIIYDGVPSITIPVGKSHELTTFTKSSVLKELNLPTSRHLQFAAIVTKNDYFPGTKTYGIRRNADIVREIELDFGDTTGELDDCQLRDIFHKAIDSYLSSIKRPQGRMLVDYDNAISALVLCKETASTSATPSAQTHTVIRNLLTELERIRQNRKRLHLSSANRALTTPPKDLPQSKREFAKKQKKLAKWRRSR